ncbi:MAG: urate hydroxylase PuuD [Pseudomonadota bacterium]
MNPLATRGGTVILGILLAILATLALNGGGFTLNIIEITVWAHAIVGIAWVGLLFYFNAVQVPAVGQAIADGESGPGPAAINKYVAPRALFWFRWAAVLTWLTGVSGLAQVGGGHQGIHLAFTFNNFSFDGPMAVLGMGAWLGTIMLFNVWVLIWPNQKKILGIKPATPEEIAKAKSVALMASRTNTALAFPMLLGMTGYAHGLLF